MSQNHSPKKDIATNKQGINHFNDKGKEPNKNRDIESTTNTNQGTPLNINREEKLREILETG